MSTDLVIPTCGRIHNQKTFNSLPDRWKERTFFVARSDEAEQLRRVWDAEVVICDEVGVPAAREAAVRVSMADKMIMLDDDLQFCKRVDDWDFVTNNRLEMCTTEQTGEALDVLERELEEYALVGLGARGFNNGIKDREWKEPYRIMRAFGFQREVLVKEDIHFDHFPYWEDFHVTLTLLKRGYINRVSSWWLCNATTNTPGGCSLYRNRDGLLQCREDFLELHGDCCSPVDKSASSWGGEFRGVDTVPDLRINWRKALKIGAESCSES